MNRAARGIIAAAIGFSGAFIVGTASQLGSEGRVTPGTTLGQLDFMRYCRETYGDGFAATLVADDAFGWRCAGRRNGVWGLDEIDVADACVTQYGRRARPHTWDPDVATSWECRAA